jgi:hypothetical protein
MNKLILLLLSLATSVLGQEVCPAIATCRTTGCPSPQECFLRETSTEGEPCPSDICHDPTNTACLSQCDRMGCLPQFDKAGNPSTGTESCAPCLCVDGKAIYAVNGNQPNCNHTDPCAILDCGQRESCKRIEIEGECRKAVCVAWNSVCPSPSIDGTCATFGFPGCGPGEECKSIPQTETDCPKAHCAAVSSA